jgi:hypothetical protein
MKTLLLQYILEHPNEQGHINLNPISLIGRLLQGDGNITVKLEVAVKIWTTSSTQGVNFIKQKEDEISRQRNLKEMIVTR